MWAVLCPLLMFPGQPYLSVATSFYIPRLPTGCRHRVADWLRGCRQCVADWLRVWRHVADSASLISWEVTDRMPTSRCWLAERLLTVCRQAAGRLLKSRRWLVTAVCSVADMASLASCQLIAGRSLAGCQLVADMLPTSLASCQFVADAENPNSMYINISVFNVTENLYAHCTPLMSLNCSVCK